jgi:hypothetical protein
MKGKLAVSTPADYLAALAPGRRDEIAAVDRFVRETCPELDPHVCAGMLAYGPFHYRYASGREGDWFRLGLASNKHYISLYVCATNAAGYVAEGYRERLPKASIGKSCVRFKRFADLDPEALRALLREAVASGFGM